MRSSQLGNATDVRGTYASVVPLCAFERRPVMLTNLHQSFRGTIDVAIDVDSTTVCMLRAPINLIHMHIASASSVAERRRPPVQSKTFTLIHFSALRIIRYSLFDLIHQILMYKLTNIKATLNIYVMIVIKSTLTT